MCGIAGAIKIAGFHCERSVLESMSQALSHRGPDDEAFYQDNSLSLAFRRLSIVDVDGGHQPIWNEDNSILIVVNGEIYNHKELRKQLTQEHQFKTKSDSEIVLHLYEEYGVDAFRHLNGMFALAIWDTRSKTLVLARDRMGIKPMYFAESNDQLIFASELKSLLMHPDCPNEIAWNDLEIDGLQQKDDISTYVKGVKFLPAGTCVTFDADSGLTQHRFWELDSVYGSAVTKTSDDFNKEYLSLLEDAVDKRLMSDVPLGIFLSGGIDSSLVTALAAKNHSDIHCFTVVERTTYRAGDVQQAKALTEQLGVPFYPIFFDAQKIAENFSLSRLEEMIYLIESPRFDPEWLFKSELHRAAKHYVPDLKVILLGQGADEFAGGYSTYLGSQNKSWQDYISNDIKPSVEFYEHLKNRIPNRLSRFLSGINNSSETSTQKVQSSYHKKMALLLNQLQFFNLWHEDRTSSYHSIESRVPFLDHRVVELLASVPESLQEELFWNKRIVRSALQSSIADYPEDKEKVPFFVTDDIASINEFAWTIVVNIYADFKNKYLSEDKNDVANSYEQLFEDVIQRRHNKFASSWQLINLMSLVIFTDYLRDAKGFSEAIKRCEDSPFPLVKDEEWDKLSEIFSQPAANPNMRFLNHQDVINIPKSCEILNPLTEEEGSTCLVLTFKGNEVRRININDQYYWVVQVIDEMGRHIEQPKQVDYWLGRSKVPEQQFFPIINDLVAGGFLEQVGEFV